MQKGATKPMSKRRQARIIHQIEAEIEAQEVAYSHIIFDAGSMCPEAQDIRSKRTKLEVLLAVAKRTFEEIAGI